MKTGNFKIIWIRYVECLLFLFFKIVIFKGLLTIYAHLKMSSGLVEYPCLVCGRCVCFKLHASFWSGLLLGDMLSEIAFSYKILYCKIFCYFTSVLPLY
jgi:hypothetical protein